MFGNLEEEDTWFELTPEQKRYFDNVRFYNSYLREEYHAIQDLLWKSGQTRFYGDLPKRFLIFISVRLSEMMLFFYFNILL